MQYNIGFIILLILGLLFVSIGVGNFVYTSVCWENGESANARIVDKSEFHGKNSWYRLKLEYPLSVDLPVSFETDVTPEFYTNSKIGQIIPFRYFEIFPDVIVADPETKWDYFVAFIFGIVALSGSFQFRRNHILLTKIEPTPMRQLLHLYKKHFN
ncbi:MAG: hypothetical protein IPP69_16655 [Flavobacteriales bacterium]|nr:hypothetical protein [Flavobacteriales bacterium]